MNTKAAPQSHWTLDKKVPIAVMVMIALQTSSIIWFAAKIESRVERHDEILLDVVEDLKEVRYGQQAILQRQVRTETLLDKKGGS